MYLFITIYGLNTRFSLLIIVINCVLPGIFGCVEPRFHFIERKYLTYTSRSIWCERTHYTGIFDVWYFAKYISFIYHLHTLRVCVCVSVYNKYTLIYHYYYLSIRIVSLLRLTPIDMQLKTKKKINSKRAKLSAIGLSKRRKKTTTTFILFGHCHRLLFSFLSFQSVSYLLLLLLLCKHAFSFDSKTNWTHKHQHIEGNAHSQKHQIIPHLWLIM